MSTVNPDRTPLNFFINAKTRADLEYLAHQQDADLAETLRAAIQWRAFVERLLDAGVLLIARAGNQEFFLMTPGYTGQRAYDRAQLLAASLLRQAPTKTP